MLYPEKYLARIQDRLKENNFGCLEWQGKPSTRGYGRISMILQGIDDEGNTVKIPKNLYVHRVVLETKLERYLDWQLGEVCMHACDNRLCANKDHLLLGTIAENVADMHSKGRAALNGKRNYHRLKAPEVLLIKLRLKMGHSAAKIAVDFGSGERTIQDIWSGKTWREIKLPAKPIFDFDPFADCPSEEIAEMQKKLLAERFLPLFRPVQAA